MNDLRTPLPSRYSTGDEDRPLPHPHEECVELMSLLIPTWQCTGLERAAKDLRLTIGQLLRRLIAAYLEEWHERQPSAKTSVRDAEHRPTFSDTEGIQR